MKKKVDLILTAGGYKYPFYNGVMRFFDVNKDKIELNSITATCSGSFVAAMHASGYNSDHRVNYILNANDVLKFNWKFLKEKSFFTFDQKVVQNFINIDTIKNKPYGVYFGLFNTKTKKVVYKDIKECENNEEIIKYIHASHAVPGIVSSPCGNAEEGYLVNSVFADPYVTENIKAHDKDSIKIVVLQGDPNKVPVYKSKLKNLRNKLETKLLGKLLATPGIPKIQNTCQFIVNNPKFLYIYPDSPFIFSDSFKDNNNFIEGYEKTKLKLKEYL